jgi:hypothetical protein
MAEESVRRSIDEIYLATYARRGPFVHLIGARRREFVASLSGPFEGMYGASGREWLVGEARSMDKTLMEMTRRHGFRG